MTATGSDARTAHDTAEPDTGESDAGVPGPAGGARTVRLTTAQALVRWMLAQRSELLDGTEVPLFAGVFGIFGHGNVLGLGTALHAVRDRLPTWRGQTEQGMALAAVAFARATDRRQVMAATSSIGPGALNMVTAAGVAHANRLPVLLLPGDTFTGRGPDPVLQQVEHYGDPTVSVNDAFRPVARYLDRITRPEQLTSTLPQVARVLTDPADAGPVVLALPQDVQAESFDFPVAMFAERVHRVPRPRPDSRALAEAVEVLQGARRPLLVAGGGARYSGAGREVLRFAEAHGVPVVETPAGRTLVAHDHPLHGGPLGIIGSTSANTLANEADVVLAVGTRLQDFTTASWTVFSPAVHLVSVNAARFDAVKHGAHAVVGDARETLRELDEALTGWRADGEWSARAVQERATWDAHVDRLRVGTAPDGSLTYAQVVGVVNDASGPEDYVVGSSGGIPGELHGGWRTAGRPAPPEGGSGTGTGPDSGATMDLEYGFSCMGYEIAGPWGAALARARTHPGGVVTALLGDGSYLMLNSELYSAAFAGHPFVAVVCDNGGYAVIHRLQTGQGAPGFNNLLDDCAGPGAEEGLRVDLAAHARALGCAVEDVPAGASAGDLRTAYQRAREAAVRTRRPAVVVCRTHPSTWTEAGAWWEVGVPPQLAGHADFETGKAGQVRWLA
jgi:3D-(3,5/4)-trihydroxycyclohexane-1,2-dione acylhydrolase (decyclizing)